MPLDFFLLLFDRKLNNDLVNWTNDYTKRTSNSKRRANHRALCLDIDPVELKGFLGMIIAISLLKIENIKEYWSHSRLQRIK